MWRNRLYAFIAAGFGTGWSPFAPGTVGTLPAVLIYVIVMLTAPSEPQTLIPAAIFPFSWQTLILLKIFILFCLLSILFGRWAEFYWKAKDPRHFVLDEIAGYLLVVLFFHTPWLWFTATAAFFASRFFDILKPPPARQIEHLKGGWGILLDDLIASVYAIIALYIGVEVLSLVTGLPF